MRRLAVNSRSGSDNVRGGIFAARALDRTTLNEEAFHRMISLERRRTIRSRKSFLLMLVDMGEISATKQHGLGLRKVLSTLSSILRETDVTGWYKEDSVVGVMFTEINLDDENYIPATMMNRVTDTLRKHLSPHQFHQIGMSFHLLPEVRPDEASRRNSHPAVFRGVAVTQASF